jgi:hypothetical protein
MAMTADTAASAGTDAACRDPILVTGTHRSGTTWVGHVLAGAAGVGYISEPFSKLHRPGILAASFDRWYPYIRGDTTGTLTPQITRMLEFRYGYGAELASLRSPRDIGRMAHDALRCRNLRSASARPLIKDPLALLAAPWLAQAFGMRVVVLIRHPAAFASSLKRMDWTHPFEDFFQPGLLEGPLAPFAAEIELFAREPQPIVAQAALLWVALNHVVLGYRDAHPDWLYVRHEDLSLAPEERFREVCAHTAVPFDTGIRRYLADSTASDNPAEARPGQAHQLKRDSGANVRGWATRLTAAEIDLVRERTATVASHFYTDADW